jgi:serine/threonine protein kinase
VNAAGVRVNGQASNWQREPESFAEGSVGRVYRCLSPGAFVYKEYKSPRTNAIENTRTVELSEIGRNLLANQYDNLGTTPANSINWPVDTVRGASGELVGVILPYLPQPFFDDSGVARKLDGLYLPRSGPPSAEVRVRVLLRLAEILRWLDRAGYVHGDLSQNNILWKAGTNPGAYLIDVDEVKKVSDPCRERSVHTPFWTDPRVILGQQPCHDRYSDRLALALAVYRILCTRSGNLLRDGAWHSPTSVPQELPVVVRQLLHRAFVVTATPADRPSAEEWVIGLQSSYFNGGRPRRDRLEALDTYTQAVVAAWQAKHGQVAPAVTPVRRPRPTPVIAAAVSPASSNVRKRYTSPAVPTTPLASSAANTGAPATSAAARPDILRRREHGRLARCAVAGAFVAGVAIVAFLERPSSVQTFLEARAALVIVAIFLVAILWLRALATRRGNRVRSSSERTTRRTVLLGSFLAVALGTAWLARHYRPVDFDRIIGPHLPVAATSRWHAISDLPGHAGQPCPFTTEVPTLGPNEPLTLERRIETQQRVILVCTRGGVSSAPILEVMNRDGRQAPFAVQATDGLGAIKATHLYVTIEISPSLYAEYPLFAKTPSTVESITRVSD